MQASAEIARPYALAAFKQANEEQTLSQWSDMLDTLALIASDPTMIGLIAHPRVSTSTIADCFLSIGADRLTATGRNFVRVLAHYDRLGLCPEIARIYTRERAKCEGRIEVHITSAYPLAVAKQKLIARAMSKRLASEVDIVVNTDKSLIGGIVIRFGDRIIDASLRGRLQRLAQAML